MRKQRNNQFVLLRVAELAEAGLKMGAIYMQLP
jgi:hypothetical protein